MDATAVTDFAASIRYGLTPRPASDACVEIVLDLYRGAVPALTRTVARVAPGDLQPVMAKCSRYLERRGAHALGGVASGMPAEMFEIMPDPHHAAPVPAFDWAFAG